MRVDYVTVDGRDVLVHRVGGALAAVQRRYQEAQSDAQRELASYFAIVPCPTCAASA
ncbi:MAG: hypothetical protein ACLSVD_19705 [Eggerthellaceae bacterium]